MESVNIVERTSKRIIILIRQTRNQVQMLMDISAIFDLLHDFRQSRKIHITINGTDGLWIGGLDTDFKLEQPLPHSFQEINGFLVNQIRCNFKVEIGHAIVMFMKIFPDCHGMTFFTVECTVDEFHLGHIFIQKFLQIRQHLIQRHKPHTIFHRRQAVSAMIRASSGRFIIYDLILHITEIIFIREWQKCQIHRMHLGCGENFISLPISQTFDFPQSDRISCVQMFQIFCENKFSFPAHDKIHRRIFPQKCFAFIAYFRSAKTNNTVRHDLFQNRTKLPQHLHIPDITGKQHHIGLFAE